MTTPHDSVLVLIQVANDESAIHSMRLAAVEGLGFAGGDYARSALVRILNNGDALHEYRVAAARALGHAAREWPPS